MKQHHICRIGIFLIACCVMATDAVAAENRTPQIQNFNAPGNLESRFDPGCITLDAAKPQYNPVDLFKVVRACIAANRFKDAVWINLLAMTYGRFDMQRVADPTAHQAITVAQMQIFGDVSAADRQTFNEFGKRTAIDPQAQGEICSAMGRLGPPAYFPRYMIMHGMGAFSSHGGDGLVVGFDPAKAWTGILVAGRKCRA